MPFTPEFPDEIRRRMLTRLIATSRLVDLSEGSEFGAILGVVSDEMSSFQQKLGEFHRAHYMDARAELLDDRVSQLPSGFERRRGTAASSGGACTLWRTTVGSELVYDPGSMTFGREDAPVNYTNVDPIVFEASSYTATNVNIRSVAQGFYTNAPAGSVTVLVNAPPDIYQVRNTLPVSGGRDRESDDDLRSRALLWLGALTRTTSNAIEALAVNFISSADQRVRTATVWEDPDNRGYCELLIDDGFGFIGSTKDAVSHTGTVPSIDEVVTRHQFTFDAPAATPPVLTVNGVSYPSPNNDYLTLEERGLMLMRSNPTTIVVEAGDSWSVGGHKVLTGLPAELQQYIEDNCRAAGTRVRVVIPTLSELRLSANVTVYPGYDIATVFDTIKKATIDYVSRIRPGSPLLIFRLCGELINIPGVRNIKFDQGDRYPGTPRTKFVCFYNNISLR